jgi:hypothetical protein
VVHVRLRNHLSTGGWGPGATTISQPVDRTRCRNHFSTGVADTRIEDVYAIVVEV